MAGKATRFFTLPGGRTKRWRNKQHQCSCTGEKHFEPGHHPDEIRTRIELRELPFIEPQSPDAGEFETEPEPDLDLPEYNDVALPWNLNEQDFKYQAERYETSGFAVRRNGSLIAFCAA